MTADDLTAVNERIEARIEALDAHPDPDIAPQVNELVRSLCELFGAGFARVLSIVGAHPGGGQALVARLAEDPLIGSLLLLNDQHPDSLERRVATAVERLRPMAASRGASITLLEVTEGRARLRIETPAPAGVRAVADLEVQARSAIDVAAPDISEVVFEHAEAALPLIQITRARPEVGTQA
ncbi:MAG: hypothetical protein AB7F99_20645 [Vicinamibacterales bacterium]